MESKILSSRTKVSRGGILFYHTSMALAAIQHSHQASEMNVEMS